MPLPWAPGVFLRPDAFILSTPSQSQPSVPARVSSAPSAFPDHPKPPSELKFPNLPLVNQFSSLYHLSFTFE